MRVITAGLAETIINRALSGKKIFNSITFAIFIRFFGCESNFQNIVDFHGSFTVYTSRRTRLILTFKSGLQLLPIGWQMYVRLHRHTEFGCDMCWQENCK